MFGETPSAWLFIAPAVVVILGLSIVPMLWSLLLSFKASDLLTPSSWIGTANYRALYHAVVSGIVKAEQKPNGRWQVDADLTPVLQHFGLKA